MIINIDNELVRLKKSADATPAYCPFVVKIFRSVRDRSPIFVRRKTLQEAQAFVEEVTGLGAVRYVEPADMRGQLYAFTGAHAERYGFSQYQPRPEDEPAAAE